MASLLLSLLIFSSLSLLQPCITKPPTSSNSLIAPRGSFNWIISFGISHISSTVGQLSVTVRHYHFNITVNLHQRGTAYYDKDFKTFSYNPGLTYKKEYVPYGYYNNALNQTVLSVMEINVGYRGVALSRDDTVVMYGAGLLKSVLSSLSSKLKRHKSIHARERSYQCKVCDKNLKRHKSSLQEHNWTHMRERYFATVFRTVATAATTTYFFICNFHSFVFSRFLACNFFTSFLSLFLFVFLTCSHSYAFSCFLFSSHTHTTRRCRPTRRYSSSPCHSTRACSVLSHHCQNSSYPFIHSFSVLLTFFFILYLILSLITLPNNFCKIFLIQPSSLSVSPVFHPFPFPSVSKCLDFVPIGFFCNRSLASSQFTIQKRNFFVYCFLLMLAGDVELNPGPPRPNSASLSSTLNISHLNIRSATTITPKLNKPAVLHEFISDQLLDILTLSETWLSTDTLPSTLQSLTPQNYSISHSPRPSVHGGGLAIIYRSCLKMSKIILPTFSSFESICARFSVPTNPSFSFTLLTIYRPPKSSVPDFVSQFSTLLEDLARSNSELIINGDFNFHVDQPHTSPASQFINLLHDFSLTQHINFPTHSANHTLDLLITRSSSTIISSVDSTDPALSDHCAILFSISVPAYNKSTRITKLVRRFRSINLTNFSNDILSSPLCTSPPPSTLESYLHLFDSTLTTILDKHAPLKSVTCSARPHKPFITPEILAQKSKRSKLETIFRRTRSPESFNNFKTQSKHVAKLITTAKRTYYKKLIGESTKQPKKLWSTLQSLLSLKTQPVLPTSISSFTLANSFLNFFNDKIAKLSSFLTPNPGSSPHFPPASIPPHP